MMLGGLAGVVAIAGFWGWSNVPGPQQQGSRDVEMAQPQRAPRTREAMLQGRQDSMAAALTERQQQQQQQQRSVPSVAAIRASEPTEGMDRMGLPSTVTWGGPIGATAANYCLQNCWLPW